MKEKVSALIKKITVNSPVFSNEVVLPTLINYFFGKNGTGKSTIAKLIGKPGTTEWLPGISLDDYELQVYNEEFIRENIQSYGNIPGVFTITKQNATVKAEVDKKTSELRTLSEKKAAIGRKVVANQSQLEKMAADVVTKLWDETEATRKAYPETQVGFTKSRQKFVSELMKFKPGSVDESAIKSLYAVAYGKGGTAYEELKPASASTIPSSPLLEKSIVSSSHTAFSDFLNALNATAWVSQGHRDYQHAAGKKCPYCQQDLPDSFEDDLASCFDERYKTEVEQLQQFIQSYKSALNDIYSILNKNAKSGFACDQLAAYATKFELFMEKAKANVARLEKKEENPTLIVELDDLSAFLQDLNDLAEQINQRIRRNNAILRDIPAKQKECASMVWTLMATICQANIAVYQSENDRIETEIAKLRGEQEKAEADIGTLNDEITQLNKKTVNTTAAKDSINALIKSSGFQGFPGLAEYFV